MPLSPSAASPLGAGGTAIAQAPYAVPSAAIPVAPTILDASGNPIVNTGTNTTMLPSGAIANGTYSSGTNHTLSNSTNGTHTLSNSTSSPSSSVEPETTQLSSSTIAAISVPLVLVALGLLLLAFMTLINRRKARRRSGSRSGPDLFDKDPSALSADARGGDSQSRWYALGLGLGDARATREARRYDAEGAPADAEQGERQGGREGRTPYWFTGQGRWMSGIGGGSLSSTTATGEDEGYGGDREKRESDASMWKDPFRRFSDGVTVTPHQPQQTYGTGVGAVGQGYEGVYASDVQVQSAGYSSSGEQVQTQVELTHHPEALLARPSLIKNTSLEPLLHVQAADCSGQCSSASASASNQHSTESFSQSALDYFAVSRKSATAVGGLPIDSYSSRSSRSDGQCQCRSAPAQSSKGEFDRYATITRASSGRSYTSSPIPRTRARLLAEDRYTSSASIFARKERKVIAKSDPGARIRDWRATSTADEVDSLASPPLPAGSYGADPNHLTPLPSEPPPTLSPMSVFDDSSSIAESDRKTDRYAFSSTSREASSTSSDAGGKSQKSFITFGSGPSLSLKQRYVDELNRTELAKQESISASARGYPVSAPRSPSKATESLHPRREALFGSRPASMAATSRAERDERIKRYTSSALSGTFITARSDANSLPSSHPFSSQYPRPPTRSNTASSIAVERGRFDSEATIKPTLPQRDTAERIIPSNSIPVHLSRHCSADTRDTRDTGLTNTETTKSGMTLPWGWGAAPVRRARAGGKTQTHMRESVHAELLAERDEEASKKYGVDLERGERDDRGERRLVREKTRKGEAWERAVLSGRFA